MIRPLTLTARLAATIGAALPAAVLLLPPAVQAAPPLKYDRDVRPILSEACFFCHGPDQEARQGDLRLDERDSAVEPAESGRTAIVPGKPEASELVRRILSDDEDERMPPADSHKSLTAAQKAALERWIAEGAKYEAHWLYAPLVRPAPPPTRQARYVANPIDAFIVHELEENGIEPSPEADRRTLLRRLSLDIVGLPPSPEEVRAFRADRSPAAYERAVDRLLASPHFGERMAVWWLDVARFADTVGFHGDQLQRIFPYRDYVIDAFNKNKPFDQFTLEQLAGDLLEHPTDEQLVATGFNRLNMMTREGGAQPKEYLAKYGADRVRTVGTTWLGSTIGCAECHDHKYDPFTQRDFYALKAFFADVKEWGYYADASYARTPELRGFGNEHPFPPEIRVDSLYLKRHLAERERVLDRFLRDRAKAVASDAKQAKAYDAWLASARSFVAKHADGWQTSPAKAEVGPAPATGKKPAQTKTRFELAAGDVIRLLSRPVRGETLSVGLNDLPDHVAALRVELVPDAAGKQAITPTLPRQLVRVTAKVRSAAGKERATKFYFADADVKEPRYPGMIELSGIGNGWMTPFDPPGGKLTSVWLFDPPLALQKGDTLEVSVSADQLVPVRVSVSPFSAIDPLHSPGKTLLAALSADKPDAAQTRTLENEYFRSTAWQASAWSEYLRLAGLIRDCGGGKAWTMVTVAVPARTVRVLPRGNWQDDSGAIVEPAPPAFLAPALAGKKLTRLDLARWLCSDNNPVTARAVINRLWKQFFCAGLSTVVDDLGAQGDPPSHPELLDWLALEFRASGWDVKHMLKLVVMSRTYRQSSSLRRELVERDPNNRLLASQNPRRLDAEFVRDNALSIAGLLNLEMGGPSVHPYQPADYYENLQFPGRAYVADTDSRQWRRGVYMHWQRTFLHPMLANFDAPAREECTASRVISNTPQQALTLLNDPTMVEAARVFAERLLSGAGSSDDAARIDAACELALARPARPRQRAALIEFLDKQRTYFRGHRAEAEQVVRVGLAPAGGLDPIEHAAWTSLARVILNLQETITRY